MLQENSVIKTLVYSDFTPLMITNCYKDQQKNILTRPKEKIYPTRKKKGAEDIFLREI
jgi:hypothetical protein